MPNFYARNECEACQVRPRAEDQVVAHLLERISELEQENDNLRKLEQTIRRNIYLFDALLRASKEGIMLLTPELTILRVIHSALGYAERDLLGEPLLSFIHPDDAGSLRESWSKLVTGVRGTGIIDFRALAPDGSWNWLRGHATDMLDDPNVHAIVLNMRRIDKTSEPAPPATL